MTSRSKLSQRGKVAKQIAKNEGLDRILEVTEVKDFCEVVGKMGGDTITYRIYDDGRIYER